MKNQVNALKSLKNPSLYHVGITSVSRRCGDLHFAGLTGRAVTCAWKAEKAGDWGSRTVTYELMSADEYLQ